MDNEANFNKKRWTEYIDDLQDRICATLEREDGHGTFVEEQWERPGGGRGKTRLIKEGNIFEKGGVNTSVVHGEVTELMRSALGMQGQRWFACGLSLVLHPFNPMVPTTHANWRYFELYDKKGRILDRWFGGGADLTPYYLFDEDAVHFHRILKDACDAYDVALYPKFKQQCDQYFNNHHRGREMRGIGGVFYDHQRPDTGRDLDWWFAFQKSNGDCFLEAYVPIVQKRKNTPFTGAHKFWQEIRRGRYVEFNLIHDRGTIFGLKTQGRTESILMSLPPTVRFDDQFKPLPGSEEAKLLDACQNPKDWGTSSNS